MIFLVTDINKSKGISSDTPWVAKLSIDRSLASKRPNEMARSIENLNSVIVPIGNYILADFVNCHASQAIKFAVTVAVAAETEPMLAVLIENLNSV